MPTERSHRTRRSGPARRPLRMESSSPRASRGVSCPLARHQRVGTRMRGGVVRVGAHGRTERARGFARSVGGSPFRRRERLHHRE